MPRALAMFAVACLVALAAAAPFKKASGFKQILFNGENPDHDHPTACDPKNATVITPSAVCNAGTDHGTEKHPWSAPRR